MQFQDVRPKLDELFLAQTGRNPSPVEWSLLEGAWNDIRLSEIECDYNANYLQAHLAPNLWRTMTLVLGSDVKVTKKRLKQMCVRYLLQQNQNRDKSNLDLVANKGQTPAQMPDDSLIIKGQPPNIPEFFGREPELALVRESVSRVKCFAVIGPPGIGKSALLSKLIEQLQESDFKLNFTEVVWKSLYQVSSIKDLLLDVLLLMEIPKNEIPEALPAREDLLIDYLKTKRCLLILDSADYIFNSRSIKQNEDLNELEEHSLFLKKICMENHSSCLVLTSQIPIIDINSLIEKGHPARSIRLDGLGKDGMDLLASRGLKDREVWGDILQLYRGNPLVLKLVASQIQKICGGSVKAFRRISEVWVPEPIKAVFETQFKHDRFSNRQYLILKCLSEHLSGSESISYVNFIFTLKEKETNLSISSSELVDHIEELIERSLIERSQSLSGEIHLQMQPAIQKIFKGYSKTFPHHIPTPIVE